MNRRTAKTRYLVPLLAPPVVLALMIAAWPLDLTQQMENVTVDRRFRFRQPADPPADPRLLLVGIGEPSLKKYGRWEDWKRVRHAEFLEKVSLRGPRLVAFDFFFSEPSANPEHDIRFADALAGFMGAVTGAVADVLDGGMPTYNEERIGNTEPIGRVVGDPGGLIQSDRGLVPLPVIAESSFTGFVNSPPSRDGMRRQVPLVVGLGGRVYPSFVLQVLMRMERIRAEDVEVRIGEKIVLTGRDGTTREIPIDRSGQMTINYRNRDGFTEIDYSVLEEKVEEFEKTGVWPANFPPVENQVLIIGQNAIGMTDFGPTPLKELEPLFLVQATALNNVLQGDYLRVVSPWPILAGWLVVAWVTVWLLRKSSVLLSVAVPLVLVAGYAVLGYHLFRTQSLQIPLFLPILGFLFGVHGSAIVDRWVAEVRAKNRIKNLFGSCAPPQVVEAMIASGEDPKLGGQEMPITAFFSDVQGFSTFSEKLLPEPLVRLMNDYLTEMTEILFSRGGTLDKYIGDAIVGMFGAPLPLPDHAYRACCAAIEMQRRQGELREKWRAEGGWPEIVYQMQTRIGLNTGLAVIGNMGSRRRFNYTMMGDNVNLAARCESGAKSYGVYTMVTGDTRRAASAAKDDIAFRFLDKIVVKGRTQPVEMYEVIGYLADISAEAAGCIELYTSGVAKYLARDWDGARAAFEKSSELEPCQPGRLPGVHTNPSLVMIARCAALKASPPGEDWDGRHVMETK